MYIMCILKHLVRYLIEFEIFIALFYSTCVQFHFSLSTLSMSPWILVINTDLLGKSDGQTQYIIISAFYKLVNR